MLGYNCQSVFCLNTPSPLYLVSRPPPEAGYRHCGGRYREACGKCNLRADRQQPQVPETYLGRKQGGEDCDLVLFHGDELLRNPDHSSRNLLHARCFIQ